ncbi:ATP-binding cassette domain-containing protein [Staphylococcus felis]|uniref:ATP-binding cassette domain-containing protein n=1 Tax=Staphylococcus felis TaxID=46127 RepID=UPI0021CF3388|nr:ATP-binding cassette domain-containing protein [Staphylococcus felis]UXR86841.1 ATP-binding cassette domain-containing protein [Staphylococcus felis]
MLEVKHLQKSIKDQMIFKDLSFNMSNAHLKIWGKSGTGKSTLARIIAGLDNNFQGEMTLNKKSRHNYTQKEWMKCIQYVPQYHKDTLDGRLTVKQILKAPLTHFKVPKASHETKITTVLEQCLLSETLLNQKVYTLSGGQFQRLWIAKALIVEPEIMILDEATTNLDMINEEKILKMLQGIQQVKLIIISHNSYVTHYFDGQMIDLDIKK